MLSMFVWVPLCVCMPYCTTHVLWYTIIIILTVWYFTVYIHGHFHIWWFPMHIVYGLFEPISNASMYNYQKRKFLLSVYAILTRKFYVYFVFDWNSNVCLNKLCVCVCFLLNSYLIEFLKRSTVVWLMWCSKRKKNLIEICMKNWIQKKQKRERAKKTD